MSLNNLPLFRNIIYLDENLNKADLEILKTKFDEATLIKIDKIALDTGMIYEHSHDKNHYIQCNPQHFVPEGYREVPLETIIVIAKKYLTELKTALFNMSAQEKYLYTKNLKLKGNQKLLRMRQILGHAINIEEKKDKVSSRSCCFISTPYQKAAHILGELTFIC